MEKSLKKIHEGYQKFRNKYVIGDQSIMERLSNQGQLPQTMVVSCCDSRVDPAVILQCDPGDLFVVRNVANIIPPFEKDDKHHGTSAALEFGIRFLHIKHLILLGHSQCGGIQALLNSEPIENDFITKWVSLIRKPITPENADEFAQKALTCSYQNCITFPWISERIAKKELSIHLWFFDIGKGQILVFSENTGTYQPL